jgi:Ca2+-dependent lipid-binding protein
MNKRRTKYISNTSNPEWHQTVDYLVDYNQLQSHFLEFTVWDYDKYNDNICLGQLILSLSGKILEYHTYKYSFRSSTFG